MNPEIYQTKALRIQRTLSGGILTLCLCLLISCERSANVNTVNEQPRAMPTAILQTGEQPLWFQLTEEGPVHLESIEDAILSCALIPWPLALHVSFSLERADELVMVINRDGFIKFSPNGSEEGGLAMYRFSGGNYWQQYTVGGFVFYEDKPAALLYLDDIFLDSDFQIPQKRTWTFNMESNTPFPLDILALESFPAEEHWSVDTLCSGSDGLIYYRVVKKSDLYPEKRMFRTVSLSQIGEEITADVFFNFAPVKKEVIDSSLPPLPKGFVYTGTERAADSIVAFWEEQEEFYIGAAGFVVIKILK